MRQHPLRRAAGRHGADPPLRADRRNTANPAQRMVGGVRCLGSRPPADHDAAAAQGGSRPDRAAGAGLLAGARSRRPAVGVRPLLAERSTGSHRERQVHECLAGTPEGGERLHGSGLRTAVPDAAQRQAAETGGLHRCRPLLAGIYGRPSGVGDALRRGARAGKCRTS